MARKGQHRYILRLVCRRIHGKSCRQKASQEPVWKVISLYRASRMRRQLQGSSYTVSSPFTHARLPQTHSKPKLTPFVISDNLSWFADHLQTLKTHPHSSKVNVSLYVTKAASSSIPSRAHSSDDMRNSPHSSTAIIQVSGGGSEKDIERGLSSPTSSKTATEDATIAISVDEKLSQEESGRGRIKNNDHHDVDPEKAAAAPRQHYHERRGRDGSASTSSSSYDYGFGYGHGHEIKTGRPDTATLIREAISSTPAQGRVLVAACGPDGLMRVVRNTTASLIRSDGPGVELHCEQFGW